MYTSDKASGAAAMRANIGNGVRCTRRANGKLVTAGRLVRARRSVELSGQHSELLEQPGEIVAVQFPGKLAASDAHDQRPVPCTCRPVAIPRQGAWWLAFRTVTVGRLSLVGSASATPSIDCWKVCGWVRVGCSSCVANRESASRRCWSTWWEGRPGVASREQRAPRPRWRLQTRVCISFARRCLISGCACRPRSAVQGSG